MNIELLPKLQQKLRQSLPNYHRDNYDYLRFGGRPESVWHPKGLGQLFKTRVRTFLHTTGIRPGKIWDRALEKAVPMAKSMDYLYDRLSDELSRETLLELAAFKILGYRKVKLQINRPGYWQQRNSVAKLAQAETLTVSNAHAAQLTKFNLAPIGYPIQLFLTGSGVHTEFIQKQYEYSVGNTRIGVDAGDTVIDCGGCWGDTMLLFANMSAPNGKVFVYEFIPGNLEVIQKNLALNPALEPSITILENPVWSKSRQQVYYTDNGAASTVSFNAFEGYAGMAETLSIDDLVKNKGLQKVDFIKMDIEGAEYEALKGAAHTIATHRPKLAVAVYHKPQDFDEIPRYIHQLVPEYRFYLKHNTIHGEETILFGEVK